MPVIAEPADEQTLPTIGDVLRDTARDEPDREAYVDGDRRLTYRELDETADRYATGLAGLGVRSGDVVGLILRNGIDLPVCFLAASRAGAITSAVNVRLGPAEQASITSRTEPVVTIMDDEIDPPARCGHLLRAGELPDALTRPRVTTLPKVAPTEPVCIVWTSGTTGDPKGAVYDHVCQERISAGMGALTEDGDRRLFVLPMPHIGFMTRVWDDFAKRVTTVMAGHPWTAERTLRIIRDERITMMTGVPTQWQLLLDHPDVGTVDWSRVRVAGIGGASIPAELVDRMTRRLGTPVLARYTSTEAGITTGTQPGDPPEVTALTVGVPAPVVDLRIVDPETEHEADGGAVGEIRCRSRAMFRGYWRDPEGTAAAIDGDGFLRTGDLGRIDADGNLVIAGRLREMYLRGGYNVYPAETERVLGDHPAVAECAVVGYPDPVLGERGAAFVVPTSADRALTLAEVQAWCGERLADYKAPDRLEIVEALPLTAMMKIDKTELARRL